MPLSPRRIPLPAILAAGLSLSLLSGCGLAATEGLRPGSNAGASADPSATPGSDASTSSSPAPSVAPSDTPGASQSGASEAPDASPTPSSATPSPLVTPPSLGPSDNNGDGTPDFLPTPSPTPTSTAPSPKPEPALDCSKVKCVALTFDDGPGPYTAQLLRTLKAADAKATFFLLGSQVKLYPQLAAAEARDGMEIGNHTWDHPQLSRLSDAEVRSEITRTNQIIKKVTGSTPPLLRPPYGDVTHAQRKWIDLPMAFWDVDTEDWKTRNTAATVASASAAKPGDIVLMHDIHGATVKAVPQIIKNLKKKGIHLVTVTTLVGGKPHPHVGYGAGLSPAPGRE